ncbi:UvrD-helicase domain-containing protein [Nocardioides sp. NPDC004968]|uniref:UvrD-helicase domain-containing protein n=1 Tax=Nocardioides sp. NPDC004968 TaxID=3155894 RepID=UPI0033A68BFF
MTSPSPDATAPTPGFGGGDRGGPGGLTLEQRRAAGAPSRRLSIAAGPGTGKTTVSARRFGVERFAPDDRHDARAVVAVSFTRSATRTLVRRIQRLWGPHAIRWPHRVITLDTIMVDLVHDLLRAQLLVWPDDHTELDVEDSWASYGARDRSFLRYELRLQGAKVEIHGIRLNKAIFVVDPKRCAQLMRQGICTHEDVRAVLAMAIQRDDVRAFVQTRLAQTIRALIVDEVYDANDLDIDVIEIAVEAGVNVTVVGDIWQAMYVFRGARPEIVPQLLDRQGFRTLRLTHSFRWQTDEQARLADGLRSGASTTLPEVTGEQVADLDVVLASKWASLWELGPGVFPIGFQAFKGGPEEAAAILVLNRVTRSLFSTDAIYVKEAITSLAIAEENFPNVAEPRLQEIVDVLSRDAKPAQLKVHVKTAYQLLSELVEDHSPRRLKPVRANYTNRLRDIQTRLLHPTRPVPGLTAHQAKGAEWDAVGVCLDDSERARLANGLSVESETDRRLYVACTRARGRTVEVVA